MIADLLGFAAGLVVPVIVYRRTGWWLNSGAGVGLQSALLFAVGFLISLLPRPGSSRIGWWLPAVLADTAAIATSTAILLYVGPGTIFPIVLAVVQAICTVAIFAGAALAIVPRLRRRRVVPPR